jgi:ariadne-1
MTCKKCKYEVCLDFPAWSWLDLTDLGLQFCWICMGEWSAHGTSWYNCNRFDDKKEAGKDDKSTSRLSLERYLHYYNRYSNHEQSSKLEKETYARIERRMEDIQNQSDLSWIEVQFLKKAVDVLSECRQVLKWTYAMAFYLVKNNHTHMFEDNQSYV